MPLVAEILPSRIYRTISKDAQRTFAGIWNRLNNSTVDSIWISNENICRKTRLPEEKLDSALSELCRAGLLEVTRGLIQNGIESSIPMRRNQQSLKNFGANKIEVVSAHRLTSCNHNQQAQGRYSA
jgi:hypothetical protein